MQMKPVAAGLASLGRGDDKVLVHMTPGEVAGLQTLAMKHGGSLTINPHTGLPEAGFLSSLLPTIAGVGLSAATGGALAPWMIGAGVGGVTALTSGSLKKGLMAGLGAYGGAGLAGGLAGMGGAVLQDEAAKTAMQGMGDIGSNAFPLGSEVAGMPAAGLTPDYLSLATNNPEVGMLGLAPPEMAGVPVTTPYAPDPAQVRAAQEAAQAASPLDKMKRGLGYFAEEPKDALSKFIGQSADKKEGREKSGLGGWGSAALTTAAAAAPLLGYGLDEANRRALDQQRDAADRARAGQTSNYYHASFNPGVYNPQTGMFEQRGFGPGYTNQTFAQGGAVPQPGEMYPQSNITRATYAINSQVPQPSEVVDGYGPKIDPFTMDQHLAQGGIAGVHHEYKAGGRLLNGPGDGMSDDIPAVIKGAQPQRAALADGEFVVPADVVSHLGNGSTKAGAKHLYHMMDKVRMARVGTKQQGRQIKAEKFLPA